MDSPVWLLKAVIGMAVGLLGLIQRFEKLYNFFGVTVQRITGVVRFY